MSIWEYRCDGPKPSLDIVKAKACIFCQTPLAQLDKHVTHLKPQLPDHGPGSITRAVMSCPCCGWWTVEEVDCANSGNFSQMILGAYGHLCTLDLSNITLPLEEVKAFLLAKSDQRFEINPRLFEETVASVFRALGYSVHVTSYQNDGGIDAVLIGSAGDRIGVQVKRYKNSIEVEQIRAFAGALFLGGFTKGVFVTTSTFQSGAGKSVAVSAARGIPIELVDWKRFYESLRIGTRSPYASFEEWKDITGDLKLHILDFWHD